MQMRNARRVEGGAIDIEMNHPDHGWIPFTAVPEGTEFMVEIWGRIQNGEAGEIGEPEPVVVQPPSQITALQFIIWLVGAGWISQAEGEAWLDGTLPQAMSDLLNSLPEEQRFAARARAMRSTTIARHDPMIEILAALHGRTPEEVDEFFIEAGSL